MFLKYCKFTQDTSRPTVRTKVLTFDGNHDYRFDELTRFRVAVTTATAIGAAVITPVWFEGSPSVNPCLRIIRQFRKKGGGKSKQDMNR